MKTHLEKGNKYTDIFINKIKSGDLTKIEASELIGVSRPTLDIRINTNMWKKSELFCVKAVCN